MSGTLFESNIPGLKLLHRGKVRDIYDLDDRTMLIVATDRISAFDVVLPTPIQGKGAVLTSISNFWFKKFERLIPNHLTNTSLDSIIESAEVRQAMIDRSVVVRKIRALPIEAIVRGYLIGSGWQDYQRDRIVCGINLPKGLQQADKLPTPLFTPSTKATLGDHDINVDYTYVEKLLGRKYAEQVRHVSLAIYQKAASYAYERGIIIADTKFEFGLDDNEQLILIDEVLTPDSSRFWPTGTYAPNCSPPSYDKQFVRDYLETLDWDKTAPGPALPDEIVKQTMKKYQQVQRLLMN